MKRHHATRAAVLVLALAVAAVLVPAPAAAHARPLPYRIPHEYATQITRVLHAPPVLNRGAVAALLSDSDLERFGRRA